MNEQDFMEEDFMEEELDDEYIEDEYNEDEYSEEELDDDYEEELSTPEHNDIFQKAVEAISILDDDLTIKLLEIMDYAYKQKFNNDIKTSDIGTFGFRELIDLQSSINAASDKMEESNTEIQGKIENNIVHFLRDISIEEYNNNEQYKKEDIELHKKLFSTKEEKEVEDDFKREVINYIAINENYNTNLQSAMRVTELMYAYLFQDGYGVKEYKGVITLGDKNSYTYTPLYTGRDSEVKEFYWGAISGDDGSKSANAFSNISIVLNNSIGVDYCGKRQFDVETIMKASRPVYFPSKITEFAMGLKPTKNTDKAVWRKSKAAFSWTSYVRNSLDENGNSKKEKIKGYWATIEPNIRDTYIDTICYVLKDFDKSLWDSHNVSTLVKNALDKVQASVCTAIVVVDYEALGRKVNKIKIRLSVTNPENTLGFDANFSKSLFGHLTTNSEALYEPATDISATRVGTEPLAYGIYEYAQEFDMALANAEPMFGYKVVKVYNEKEQFLSWDKILLGRDVKGTPLFASGNDSQAIPLQKHLVHNIYAGSRAGKGVMTMNILASAVASRKPIFYLDRKPDMAVTFYEMSEGKMFIINGSSTYDSDFKGYFRDDGDAVAGWQTYYDKLPDYIKNVLKINSRSYYVSSFGDIVYLRSIILILGILNARKLARASSETLDIFNKLGGVNGFVTIVDEFNSFVGFEESILDAASGTITNSDNLLTKEIESKIQDLTIEIDFLEKSLTGDEKKDAKNKLAIAKKRNALSKYLTDIRLYCTTFIDKLNETKEIVRDGVNKGWKNKEQVECDIFIIGQDMSKNAMSLEGVSTIYRMTKTAGFEASEKGQSVCKGFLNLWSDYIIGYEMAEDDARRHKYAGQDSDPESNKWIAKRMYWGYTQNNDLETIRTSKPSDMRFFMPYLVLNNSNEPDPDNEEQMSDPEYSFVKQSMMRVNDAAPGQNLWEKIRLKHLASQEFVEDARSGVNKHYGQLDKGIGFEGLVSYVIHGNNPTGDIKSEIVDILSYSGTMANFVANKLGYATYQDYLYDFSPSGLFSASDIGEIVVGNRSCNDYKARLPLYAKYNKLDLLNGVSSDDAVESSFGNPYGNEQPTQTGMQQVQESAFGNPYEDEQPAQMDTQQVQDIAQQFQTTQQNSEPNQNVNTQQQNNGQPARNIGVDSEYNNLMQRAGVTQPRGRERVSDQMRRLNQEQNGARRETIAEQFARLRKAKQTGQSSYTQQEIQNAREQQINEGVSNNNGQKKLSYRDLVLFIAKKYPNLPVSQLDEAIQESCKRLNVTFE